MPRSLGKDDDKDHDGCGCAKMPPVCRFIKNNVHYLKNIVLKDVYRKEMYYAL